MGFSVWMAHGPWASYIAWSGGHAQGSPDDTGQMTGSHLREGLLREYSGVNNPPSLYDPVAGALGGGSNGLIPMAGQGYTQDDINALKGRLGTPGDPRATTGIVQVTTPGSGNTQVSVMAQEGARSGGGATNGPTPPPKPGQSDNPAPASDEAKGNGSTRINYGTGTGTSSGVIDFDQEALAAELDADRTRHVDIHS